MTYQIWILTVDLNNDVIYFSWDCLVCEANMHWAKKDFLGTHYNEDYCLGVF